MPKVGYFPVCRPHVRMAAELSLAWGPTSFTLSVLHEQPPVVLTRGHLACDGAAAPLQFLHCSSGLQACTAMQHMLALDIMHRLHL